MMIIVPRHYPLPVGQVWTPPPPVVRGGTVQKELVLVHPEHGEYRGPIFVVREVTRDDYMQWCEEETGERPAKTNQLNPKGYRFYEIAMD